MAEVGNREVDRRKLDGEMVRSDASPAPPSISNNIKGAPSSVATLLSVRKAKHYNSITV